jgi:hypothetical protein
MRIVEYLRPLETNRQLPVRFESEHGRILHFSAQLEFYRNEWRPVIRYDTAHGYAHCDIIHPYREARKVRMEIQNYNEALTLAIDDLVAKRDEYIRRYEEWLSQP